MPGSVSWPDELSGGGSGFLCARLFHDPNFDGAKEITKMPPEFLGWIRRFNEEEVNEKLRFINSLCRVRFLIEWVCRNYTH